MKTSITSLLLIAAFSSSAIATPVCGVPSALTVIASDAGGDSTHPYGLLKFNLAGKTYSDDPVGAADGNGTIDFIDPSVMAGFVSILALAQINKAQVCFDTSKNTLTLK